MTVDVRNERLSEFVADGLYLNNSGNGYPGYGTVRIYYGNGNATPLQFDADSAYIDNNLTVGGLIIGVLDCLSNADPEANDGAPGPGASNSVARYDHKHRAPAWGEVTAKPDFAAVATSGAYSDLSGRPSLASVATSGAYADLSGKPTLGSAAALDAGTASGNLVQLSGASTLPALNGAALTGVVSAPVGAVVTVSTDTTLDSSYSNKLIVCTANVTLTLPAASGLAALWTTHIKPQGGTVTLQRAGSDTIDGGSSIKAQTPGWGRQLRAFSVVRATSSTFWSY